MFDTVAGIIGDRSAVLILRALFTNQTSFIEIQTDTQLASNILSERLKWLIDLAIVCKRDTAHEARQSYELTQKGDDLYPILLTLMAWGDEWYSSETGPPVHLQHQICGQLMKTALVCSECHQETGYRDITFSLGHEN